MPSWSDLLAEFSVVPGQEKGRWIHERLKSALESVGSARGGRHVVLYGSSFLQKPQAPGQFLQITTEDVHGYMGVFYGMNAERGLTLILHTPGGVTNAVESIVDYVRSKFDDVEVVVPTMAMSAGTMISLSSDRIIMGRHSQLGPIDPQMFFGGRIVSAQAIVAQFARARDEIVSDTRLAHVWAPVLQSLGPSLLQEAENAIQYSETIVARYLARYMLRSAPDPDAAAQTVASHFNDAREHKDHGRRIGLIEARSQGLDIVQLEDDQQLQEAVLTAYHLMTIAIENGPIAKLMWSDTGQTWLKNWLSPADQQVLVAQQALVPGELQESP